MKKEDRLFAVLVVCGVALAFLFFYGGASVLSAFVPWRVTLDLPIDRAMPFVAWSAVVYLSMDLLVGVAPFVLGEPRRLAAFAALLIVQMAIASVFFVLMPVADAFPPRVVEGGASIFFQLADTMNLERNYFPSLHVAFSFTAALAYPRRAVWFGWAIAITVSTFLLHEHYVLDALGGIALAVLVHRAFWKRAIDFDFAEACRTEWLVFTDFVRFGLRHRRYVPINLALYALAFPRFRQRRVLRTGYAFLQVIDDVLDGDRHSDLAPITLAKRAATELTTTVVGDDHVSKLTRAFVRDAPPEAIPVAIALINTMIRDAERAATRAQWSEDEIHQQLNTTFAQSLDVLLICARSNTRASDVPSLVELMSWCSAVRDLDEDLSRGLINVPPDVDRERWLDDESARIFPLFDAVQFELARLTDRGVAKWLGVLARSTRKYLRQPCSKPRVIVRDVPGAQ